MPRYALRAVPWGTVAAGVLLVPALVALTAAWPDDVWPLQGVAVGLVAAVAAWSMDERAAAVVDTLPRALWWRTAARCVASVPPVAAWVVAVLVAAPRLPDHAGLFVLQGLAAATLGAGLAVAARGRGQASPGRALAPALLAVAAVLALVGPLADQVPLFPLWPGEPWARSAAIWWTVLAAGVLVAAPALTGLRLRPPRGRAVPV